MNHVIEGMPLKGEAKKAYQKLYMPRYMREYRKKHPPTIVRAIFQYNDVADINVVALWASNRESGTLRYPETDWDDDMLALLEDK